jgi:hypothetical protein
MTNSIADDHYLSLPYKNSIEFLIQFTNHIKRVIVYTHTWIVNIFNVIHVIYLCKTDDIEFQKLNLYNRCYLVAKLFWHMSNKSMTKFLICNALLSYINLFFFSCLSILFQWVWYNVVIVFVFLPWRWWGSFFTSFRTIKWPSSFSLPGLANIEVNKTIFVL